MKETLTFESVEEKIVLPISYNHLIQGMIYRNLDDEIGTFLHDKGFQKEKRTYKMFSFSRLVGKFYIDREKEKIIFKSPIELTISSPYNSFNNSIGKIILLSENIQLADNNLKVKELKVKHEKIDNEEINIRTLSPIVIYSTLYKIDGKKFTYYFNPYEKEFSELISDNLKNKYRAFYNEDPPEGNVEVQPISKMKLSVVKYKDYVIKGYSGKFYLKGPIPLLELGISTGLGSKNSQGFGCVEIIND